MTTMSGSRARGQSFLQVLFSIFLGLLITGFVGIGVNTFYPAPSYDEGGTSAFETYWLVTSVILLVCATALMVVALVITQVPVLSNGVLLGGLFTLLYAVGISITSVRDWPRFIVVTIALAVTIGVGWWKFARDRTAPTSVGPAVEGSGAPAVEASGVPADVEGRLAAVEGKLDALARALRE